MNASILPSYFESSTRSQYSQVKACGKLVEVSILSDHLDLKDLVNVVERLQIGKVCCIDDHILLLNLKETEIV